MEQNLTFDQLPKAVTMLTKEVSDLKRLLIEKQVQTPTEQPEQLLTVQEAAQFLNLTVPTIYSKVSKGELPVMKRSKRLYFSNIELIDYLKEGRKKSNAEIVQEAEAYLSNNKKRLQ
ncbi:helix-turn-helix domain-containing protein [Maribacter arcticus]|uniref:Transcriptional regulator, AlpA family n=1 Tax=Maribacter arcticus TaxID=561365 RepID=A0A1T5AK02_9FLAO|nr:helix-turn-helix domain-containing protein [Maribacter arcticus]SKB35097.1 transcriptional regulator, AlpA family [Maribacter arcticus]